MVRRRERGIIMLGGLEPIIIFQFSKLSGGKFSETIAKIPLISSDSSLISQPPIPLYLSAQLTGLEIESEDKNVDIETDVETLSDGEEPNVNQKGISSVVSINLLAKKDSIYLSVLSAMIDQIFDKVTSKEYAISYLNGPVTVFRGVLHSFQVNQTSQNDLMSIKIEISKGQKQPEKKIKGPTLEPTRAPIPGPA